MENDPEEEFIITEEVVEEGDVGALIGEEVIYADETGRQVPCTTVEENTPSETPNETFHSFCQEIDPEMDANFKLDCWRLYHRVYGQCCLEGPEMPWLASAIYVQQQLNKGKNKFPLQTKFKYPLSKVLMAGKVSPLDFFDRVQRFVEMVNGPQRLAQQCQRIQASLAISAVVYKKLLPIFRRLFISTDPVVMELYRFIWIMFLSLKKNLTAQSEDLMTCFHLLLCCVNVVIKDIIGSTVETLLNPDFVSEVSSEETNETVLELLCKWFEGVILDAKHFKTHWFEHNMPQVIEFKTPANIPENLELYSARLNEIYDNQMLQKGDFDERMFVPPSIEYIFDEMCDSIAIDLLRRGDPIGECTVDSDLILRMNTQSCLEKIDKSHATPLSGKAYIMSSEQFCPMTPNTSNSFNLSKLHALIPVHWTLENSELQSCLGEFRDNPLQMITQMVELLGDKFERQVHEERTTHGENYDSHIVELVHKHRDTATTLCYRLLEKITLSERDRLPYREVDFTSILRKDELIASVFVVAVELVLFSYGSDRQFPWILDVIRLPPVHFYKVIEFVVRSESLPREMVKHLNRVEERVLEELAWTLDSPLWALLQRRADGVPSCETVWSPDLYSPMKRRRLDDEADMLPHSSVVTHFFKKIYFLASVRLFDLCDRLKIDEKNRNKIWTLVEYFLRTETSLLAGRHLDQNLMCCIYMICRLSCLDITFNTIMAQYKLQPQAHSRIYRQVAVDNNSQSSSLSQPSQDREESSISGEPTSALLTRSRSTSVLPASGGDSEPSSPDPPDYIDIIKYYNRVFMARMEEFAKRLYVADGSASIIPFPVLRSAALSPQKRIIADRVSVQSLTVPYSSSSNRPSNMYNKYGGIRSPIKVEKPLSTRRYPIPGSFTHLGSQRVPSSFGQGQYSQSGYNRY